MHALLVALAASLAAAAPLDDGSVVQLNAPTADVTVCGQLTVTWGFALGSLNDSTLFSLIMVPADVAPTATTSFTDLTTAMPVSPPESSGSPGRREYLDYLARRDDARQVTVSDGLLVTQSGFTLEMVAAPAGSYVLTGQSSAAVLQIIPSAPFTVADSADESCVPPPPLTTAPSGTGSTSSAAPSSTSSGGGGGVSTGAVAGAVIGAFVLGLLVFLGLFFLCCRRTRHAEQYPTDTPLSPIEAKAERLGSGPPSTPMLPPPQRAELAAAIHAANLPGTAAGGPVLRKPAPQV